MEERSEGDQQPNAGGRTYRRSRRGRDSFWPFGVLRALKGTKETKKITAKLVRLRTLDEFIFSQLLSTFSGHHRCREWNGASDNSPSRRTFLCLARPVQFLPTLRAAAASMLACLVRDSESHYSV